MFVELGKKNAEGILSRLVERIKKNMGTQMSAQAEIEYKYSSWTGNGYADMDTINDILKKFNKKM